MRSPLVIRRLFTTLIMLVTLLSTILIAAPVQSAPPAQEPAPGSETLNMIQTTIIPPRDRIDLARRLLGVTSIPEPPTTAPELSVGDVVSFWADNLDQDYSFQVDAELIYKTDHVYMFVEVGQSVSQGAIKQSADAFESAILPKVHEFFGSEWTPGIDGDPHLYVLHASNLGGWVAAYYGSSSQYPVVAVENSNEHEMFYVNLDTMADSIGTPYYEGVLAHEFQHMVQWYVDSNEDTWLNEGLSELATMLTGYGASGFATDFLFQPNIQLNHWPEEGDRGIHYGAAFLFTAYFLQRYGEEATRALVRDPDNGLKSMQTTLTAISATDPATGQPETVDNLFTDWVVANLLQNPSLADGRYGYTYPDLSGLFSAALTDQLQPGGTMFVMEAPQWGAHYLEIEGGATAQRVRITFKGQPTVSVVPTAAHSGRFMWWANRADDSNMRLTRTFDLTGVSSATLNFWTWYYIEELWDYGYLMVSTDGGATWTPITTTRTTDEDPHGNAYGPGYTGQSGGWVQEIIDLTPYVGQPIQIRFEYITDDAVTQPGLIIDDVSIPEIGYSEDFENGPADWVSEGWLLMDNVLPQDFVVQLVQTTNAAAPVTRWLSRGDAPQGEWEIMIGGEYGNPVLVVSGLAPVTTQPAEYSLIVTAIP